MKNNLRDCLELGFYHGVSSIYIASILQNAGSGNLTTIDLLSAKQLSPNIEQLLVHFGLNDRVRIYYEPRSYNWRLMKLIESGFEKSFDFCYIDGGHNWYDTGYAFFLVEKLLRKGGWIVLDDLDWTLQSMIKNGNVPNWVRNKPVEERETRQVRKVWELLVKQHPNFGDFQEYGQWGFARKRV